MDATLDSGSDSSAEPDSPPDASALAPPSCQAGGAGLSDCGATPENCCVSLEVTGGTYYRTYYYWPTIPSPYGQADPATVSSFRLDKYLVTVGRYRQFVNAWNGGAGYTPPAGSGKHTHLNGGLGLVSVGGDAGLAYEPGWIASDDGNIAPTDANLACDGYATWTPSPGTNENLPVTCVNPWEAQAFCIWDGGFLASEAEWEYAAGGGSQLLQYPWGSTDPGWTNQYAIFGCYYPTRPLGDATAYTCTGVENIAPVGMEPLGAGLWGQLDLAGEVWEWTVDRYAPYISPCVDCAYLQRDDALWASKAGAFYDFPGSSIYPTGRGQTQPVRSGTQGFRCARTP